MSCISLDTPESRIRELEEKLKRFTQYAVAHEHLEAAMLTDGGSWTDEMLEQFQDEFQDVQGLRNRALGR